MTTNPAQQLTSHSPSQAVLRTSARWPGRIGAGAQSSGSMNRNSPRNGNSRAPSRRRRRR